MLLFAGELYSRRLKNCELSSNELARSGFKRTSRNSQNQLLTLNSAIQENLKVLSQFSSNSTEVMTFSRYQVSRSTPNAQVIATFFRDTNVRNRVNKPIHRYLKVHAKMLQLKVYGDCASSLRKMSTEPNQINANYNFWKLVEPQCRIP